MRIVATRDELEQIREKCRKNCCPDCVLFKFCNTFAFVKLTEPEMATFIEYVNEHSHEYIEKNGQWINTSKTNAILITNKKE